MLRDLKLGTRVSAGFGAVSAMIIAMAVLCLALISDAYAAQIVQAVERARDHTIAHADAEATIRSQLAPRGT